MQSQPLLIKFTRIMCSTLLHCIFSTNSLDLILDFVLTFVSAIFNYAGPFFFRQVL
ncbi:hypothetical protein L208DRAFT_1212567, partial [Tricholoma matsutake]